MYALTKERDTLRREQNKKSDAAALLKEKDEIINQVMAEGIAMETLACILDAICTGLFLFEKIYSFIMNLLLYCCVLIYSLRLSEWWYVSTNESRQDKSICPKSKKLEILKCSFEF